MARRGDAALVYADAGRRAARHLARGRGGLSRLLTSSPASVRRRFGARSARSTARRLLGLDLDVDKGLPQMRLTDTLATRAGAPGAGCYFYGAVIAELLRLAGGFEGAMIHEKCRSRGDEICFWRAAEPGGYE